MLSTVLTCTNGELCAPDALPALDHLLADDEEHGVALHVADEEVGAALALLDDAIGHNWRRTLTYK